MVDFPLIKIFEWNTAELANPSGSRHLAGGSFPFRSVVSEGCSSYDANNSNTTSGTLIFEDTKFTIVNGAAPSHIESKVTAVTLHMLTSGVAVGNIRFIMVDDGGLQAPLNVNQDPAFIQYTVSGIWQPNALLPSGAGTRMTKDIPMVPNVNRQDGYGLLVGESDRNASQYVYFNVVLPWGHPLGSYGACGSGTIKLAFTFDYHSPDYILQFGEVF